MFQLDVTQSFTSWARPGANGATPDAPIALVAAPILVNNRPPTTGVVRLPIAISQGVAPFVVIVKGRDYSNVASSQVVNVSFPPLNARICTQKEHSCVVRPTYDHPIFIISAFAKEESSILFWKRVSCCRALL